MKKEGNKRIATILQQNHVHTLYSELRQSLGELAPYVSQSYYYDRIQEQTRLSVRTISHILNHTTYTDLSSP